ncbi:MAG: cysteine desulfurase family protein [Fibrobacterota bacterium]
MTECNRVYLDHNATTPVDPAVIEEVCSHMQASFGNPSAVYSYGQEAAQILARARLQAARFLGGHSDEIVFTSGGTEADVTALQGLCKLHPDRRHLIASSVEHSAVFEPAKELEQSGYSVTWLPVDSQGRVNPQDFSAALRPDTLMASVILANNETGVIQDIPALARIAGEAGVYFHTDAVQAAGKIPLDVNSLEVDMLSLSGHKFGGPKGTGLLWVRRGLPVAALLRGGGQENRRRSGTENVPALAGLGLACNLAGKRLKEYDRHCRPLRTYLEEQLQAKILQTVIHGTAAPRLANTVNASFPGEDGEALVIQLDLEGICLSTGSACGSRKRTPSRILTAMNVPSRQRRGALRFSLSMSTTKKDIDRAVAALAEIILG